MNRINRLLVVFFLPVFVVLAVKMITTQDSLIDKSRVIPQKNNKVKKIKKHVISVFVHGAILPYPSWNALTHAFSRKKDKNGKKNGFFQTYQESLRFGLIYKCQLISELGLRKIDIQETNGKRNILLADAYKYLYQTLEDHKNTTFSLYTFGWDGVMTLKRRRDAGFALYDALTQEVETIKKEFPDKEIVLEVLAHSHGGNVCLNLANAEEERKNNLVVDRLVLFGVPVQSETSQLVIADMFKKVYNFYSSGDFIQVCDIISSEDFHSKRRFESNEKLFQIKVSIGNKCPLHNELWFLNDSDNLLYRNGLLINPLPLLVFAPLIINHVEAKNMLSEDIVLHITKNKKNLDFIYRGTCCQDSNSSCYFPNFGDFIENIWAKLV